MISFRKVFFQFPAGLAAFSCLAMLILVAVMVSPAWASKAKTSFLPLKINSPGESTSLTAKADSDLQAALAESGITFVPRIESEKMANYHGSWPPPVKVMQDIAAKTDCENLATGNLTLIGNQISIDVKLFDLLAPNSPTYYFQTNRLP